MQVLLTIVTLIVLLSSNVLSQIKKNEATIACIKYKNRVGYMLTLRLLTA